MNRKALKKKQQRKQEQKSKKAIDDLLELREKMMKAEKSQDGLFARLGLYSENGNSRNPENTVRLPFPEKKQQSQSAMFVDPLEILRTC